MYFSYNRRKLDELPFQHYQLNPTTLENSTYLNDLKWIYEKVCGSNCFQLLEDIYLSTEHNTKKLQNKFIELLKDFLENSASILHYDGQQFYAHLYSYLEQNVDINSESNPKILEVLKVTKNPPVLSLIPLSNIIIDENQDITSSKPLFQNKYFDQIIRLPETEKFVVSVSTNEEEICVWDIKR